jgi:hypothetical protein
MEDIQIKIAHNMTNAYKGHIGQQREIFCAEFIRQKKESYNRIQSEILKQIEAKNEKVTCHKGCSDCCVLYIEANIQESEAIVCFLYQRQDILSGFLKRYDLWRHRMRQSGDPFSNCERILHEGRQEKISRSDQYILLDTLRLYHEQNITCPFLCDGVCTIYEVRPYVCANHYVTTPREWCKAVNWCNPDFPDRPMVYMTEIDEIGDLSFYYHNLSKPVVGFVPTTVYNILTNGLNYICDVTGMTGLLSKDSEQDSVTG